ncbi:helix-turn-helix transcriptional regulator [Treponema sp. OMZ 799]|uniref:helix-turn-helix domain-containing protein n=1 Tax=Treponema sp. OMZ 799 TaxID=2563668 RepID=UPI0020A2E14A|nr:helix-turn-helix transcriptional regulator [Treponema sp. OMZ 799]UTC78134.1 helix-turn-helix transcriptional regulator [Treponema sp. OMZ 799]
MNTLFWQKVNNLIKIQNKTQQSVSIECGFNPRRIQNLSASNRLPDIIEAKKIADVLGVSLESLVSDKEPDFKPSVERIRGFLKEIEKELENF